MHGMEYQHHHHHRTVSAAAMSDGGLFTTNHHMASVSGSADGVHLLGVTPPQMPAVPPATTTTNDCFYASDYWNIPYANGLTPMKQIEGKLCAYSYIDFFDNSIYLSNNNLIQLTYR